MNLNWKDSKQKMKDLNLNRSKSFIRISSETLLKKPCQDLSLTRLN